MVEESMVEESRVEESRSGEAGSHGQCFSDRGFFSCPISGRQGYVVNLNGARRYRGLVQGKIVARPPPILRPLDRPSTNRIQVHIFQALFKLPFVPYKPVPCCRGEDETSKS
jgi:hypothetical protein